MAGEQQHFDGIADRYQQAADTWVMIYEQMQSRLDGVVAGKRVLDVGNGGKFAYDTALPEHITAMDIAPQMLDAITDPAISKLVGDARDMRDVDDASRDIIVFLLVLHHINGRNLQETGDTLTSILKSSYAKLKPGGYLVITEALLSKFTYRLQKMLFGVTRFVLGRFGVSMIFFFTLPVMIKQICEVFGISESDIEIVPLELKGWLDPLGGSFPGVIKIPASVQPWDFTMFLVRKPDSDSSRGTSA